LVVCDPNTNSPTPRAWLTPSIGGFNRIEFGTKTAADKSCCGENREARDVALSMMDPLAKRIASHEAAREVLRQSLNDAHFQSQTAVANLTRERLGANQKLSRPTRQSGDNGKKGRGSAWRAQGLRSYAAFVQGVESLPEEMRNYARKIAAGAS